MLYAAFVQATSILSSTPAPLYLAPTPCFPPQGIHPISALFLDIAVRRSSLLADAAQQLAARPANHLKRPLRVSFMSQGVAEEGVDQGGVSREFFQLLVGLGGWWLRY
jgi:hypothetical protein